MSTKEAEAAEIVEEDRFLRAREVMRMTNLARNTIWKLEHAGRFPRRRLLSPGRIGWLRSEVIQWMRDRTQPNLGDGTRDRTRAIA